MSRCLLYFIIKCDDIRELFRSLKDVFVGILITMGVLWFLGTTAVALACEINGIVVPCKVFQLLKLTVFIIVLAGIITIISQMLHRLIPSTKEMAVLLVVPPMTNALINSKTLQRFPKKIIDLAEDWIDKLSPKKVNNN
ncbi:MAG: hypothetical protein KKD77_21535 [Gammaproteobacteria bacterium]|nr:hypothetical protein [Gammaproteobacteria bacterium]